MTKPLSTKEVAEMLDVDVRTIQRWCRAEKGKRLEGAYKVDGTWLVPPEAVAKLQEKKQDDLS